MALDYGMISLGCRYQHMMLEYSSPRSPKSERHSKAFVAIGGTWVFAGIGHWLMNDNKGAKTWCSIQLALLCMWFAVFRITALFWILPALCLTQASFIVWVYIDAYMASDRDRGAMPGTVINRYIFVVILIVIGICVHIAIRYILSQVAGIMVIPTAGMAPTLQPGDCLLELKHKLPARWSVIAFRMPQIYPGVHLLRVAGLPGETIEISGGGLIVDGQAIRPPSGVGPYISPNAFFYPESPGRPGRPIRLGKDEYFLLGDNSAIALDSRYWNVALPGHPVGAISIEYIDGVVSGIVWPLRHFQRLR